MKYGVFFLAVLILSTTASAATLSGEVFDFSLDRVDRVKIDINSTPSQRQITEDGSYRFELPPGTYELKAEQLVEGVIIASTEETVLIPNEGDFILDLLLFPVIEEFEVDPIEVDEDILPEEFQASNYILFVFLLIIAFIISIGYAFHKKNGKDEQAEDLLDIVSFIKKQGGRTTQKDIRKAFPQSEAKISLILTELEEKGKIKKIKKGRGNVIILQ